MTRAAKPCSTPGCPNLSPCPLHTPPAWAGSTRRRRLPPGWARLRRRILHRDPTCTECGQRPSTEVDHLEAGDNHDPSNLRGICTPCHRTKSSREGHAARNP
jgi:5-methylcytosine-specific restriction enzyme A